MTTAHTSNAHPPRERPRDKPERAAEHSSASTRREDTAGSDPTLDEQVRAVAHAFIERFFYERARPSDIPVTRAIPEELLDRIAIQPVPARGRPVDMIVDEMVETLYAYGARTDHPGFFGFIPGPASSLSWLGDVLTNAYNLHGAVKVNAPAALAAERSVLDWLGTAIGYDHAAGIEFVSGGSLANLTALTVARDTVLGATRLPVGTAYLSTQTHMSVVKALSILGVPAERIRRVPVDEQFRLDPVALDSAIAGDLATGLVPFVVVATAGSTNTGAIDPLREIAEVSSKHKTWMHVDGAFGASALLSRRHRDLLAGIELADSLSWDAHKWLFQTYGLGVVAVKNWRHLAASFHSSPEYLRDVASDDDRPNPNDLGIELTRPTRGLKLWLTLHALGTDTIERFIDHGVDLAIIAQREVEARPGWEVTSPAQLAITTFRYAPSEVPAVCHDALNTAVSRRINRDGKSAVFTTEVHGKIVLRIAAIHPQTTAADIRATISRLDEYARELGTRFAIDDICRRAA